MGTLEGEGEGAVRGEGGVTVGVPRGGLRMVLDNMLGEGGRRGELRHVGRGRAEVGRVGRGVVAVVGRLAGGGGRGRGVRV